MTSGLDARSWPFHGKRLEKEMFRKLIVGLDGLDGGADALALARTLASEEAEFVLVHAYPYDHRASGPSGLDYEALIRADAEKLLADAAPEDRGTTMLAVADRSPARALHRAAEEQEADLIVIGSCRRSAFGRVLVGDVSHATLHGPHALWRLRRAITANRHSLCTRSASASTTPANHAPRFGSRRI